MAKDSSSHRSDTLVIGLMIFGLCFGAGNLIFPVQLGRLAGGATSWAGLGFLLTAVSLPILGVVATATSGSRSLYEMTSHTWRGWAAFFTCLLYLTIGPAFAIPRTATVSFEIGVRPFLGEGPMTIPLLVFTLIFFTLAFLVALHPGRLLDWVGRFLTPLFLVLLAVLVVATIVKSMPSDASRAAQAPYTQMPFLQGVLDGYNTMDALATLAFAIIIVDAIHQVGRTSRRQVASQAATSGIVALVALSIVYICLMFLGRTSQPTVPEADNGGTVLAETALHYYGHPGEILIGAIVLVACLKTAIGLIAACAEMFATMFPRAMSVRAWVVVFSIVSTLIANAGLDAIITWAVPVLMFVYPLAISTIILGLLTPWLGHDRTTHRFVTVFVAVSAFFDLVRALPVNLPGASVITSLGTATLPGYEAGFGWTVPFLVGLAAGIIASRARRNRDPLEGGAGRAGNRRQDPGASPAQDIPEADLESVR